MITKPLFSISSAALLLIGLSSSAIAASSSSIYDAITFIPHGTITDIQSNNTSVSISSQQAPCVLFFSCLPSNPESEPQTCSNKSAEVSFKYTTDNGKTCDITLTTRTNDTAPSVVRASCDHSFTLKYTGDKLSNTLGSIKAKYASVFTITDPSFDPPIDVSNGDSSQKT